MNPQVNTGASSFGDDCGSNPVEATNEPARYRKKCSKRCSCPIRIIQAKLDFRGLVESLHSKWLENLSAECLQFRLSGSVADCRSSL
ncbi:hypothetical protein T07_12016 [Trichinella nelsoni]|uniref:Uncharacterized protein n=1 Tax=Trichinella nelsoni TaxID=6336 RepID=A0A0V0RJ17_9BILA|nr:hypothetical protein T07_12016 [Trichinella nelsoni]